MRILVTGASGYIGSHLVPELRQRGHEVVRSDLGVAGDGDYIKSDVRYAPDVFYAVAESEPEVVIHMAGEVGIDNGQAHADALYDVNVLGALNVARACMAHDAFMVSFSTSDVFGSEFEGRVVDEESPPASDAPQNHYAASKLCGEMVVRQAWRDGLRGCIVRPFMVYGPGEPANRWRSAMVRFCAAALTGEPFTVHEDTERGWCHIDDFCDGVIRVTESKQHGVTFHIGNREYRTMQELAAMVVSAAGQGVFTVEDSMPDTRSARKRFAMDNTMALGYKPNIPLALGVQTVIDSIRG